MYSRNVSLTKIFPITKTSGRNVLDTRKSTMLVFGKHQDNYSVTEETQTVRKSLNLKLVPLTLKQANELIAEKHRHHKPVVGHRFTIGAQLGGKVVGAAVTGRPVGRETEQYSVAEVTRLVADGTPHVCSKLYSASARAAQAMGYDRIQTFILDSETGASLVASGWYRIKATGEKCDCSDGCKLCTTSGGDWNHSWRKGRRTDQPMTPKQRWGKCLTV